MTWRGLDTETDPKGKCVLLGSDLGTVDFPRSLLQALRWLEARGEFYAAFNSDFDLRALLRLDVGARRLLSLNYHGFSRLRHGVTLSYIPNKEALFTLPGKRRPSVRIYNTSTFFQGHSLASAAWETLRREKGKIPEEWYRSIVERLRDPETAPLLREYCQLDATLARDLMRTLDKSFTAAGVDFRRPISPGYCAAQYFRSRLPKPPPTAEQIPFQWSYYGGRIEVWRRGKCGPLTCYDLKSAYPAALAGAPYPTRPRRVERWGEEAAYGAYLALVRVPDFPALPYRSAGEDTISYPIGTWIDWYTRPHLLALRAAGGDFFPLIGFECPGSKERLELGIAEMYARRKSEPALSLAYKLLLNACYGKLCERTETWARVRRGRVNGATRVHEGVLYERGERSGSLTNFILGSYITASTQARLVQAALLAPESVVTLSTDGIAFAGEGPYMPLRGSRLGDWDLAGRYSDSLVVAPGIYTLRDESGWSDKRRGLSKHSGPSLHQILNTDADRIPVPVMRADSIAECAARGKFEALNTLREATIEKSLNGDTKREWDRPAWSGRDLLRSEIRSEPVLVLETPAESRRRLRRQGRLPYVLWVDFGRAIDRLRAGPCPWLPEAVRSRVKARAE